MLKTKVKPKSVLLYLFVFSLIYQSGSVRAALLGDGILFQITRALLLLIPIIIIARRGIDKKLIILLFIFLTLGIIFACINFILFSEGVLQLSYKIIILTLSMGFYLTLLKEKIDINFYIYKIIIVIASIGLLFYFCTDLLKLPIPYSVVYSGNSYRYHNYFELYFSYHYNQTVPRLSGLFWEPGAYQIYLNTALFFYVFENKDNKIEFAILLISILFCQSTMGYCIATLLLAIYFSQVETFKRKDKTIIGCIGLVIALVVGILILYRKVQATIGYDEGSAALRFADISNGLNVFYNHPIIGTGFGNEREFIVLDKFGRGSSNGLLSYAYMTGLIGLFFAFFPFLRNLFCKNKKRQIVWIVFVILINSSEPIYNLPIMSFYLGVEYAKMLKKRSYNRRMNVNVK